jgi:hypothetical protein
MVSVGNLQAFLGWLYGQDSLVHSRPLQLKSAQILVGRSLGKMSMALMLFLVRKNMPISVIGRCFVWSVAPLQWGFFWRCMADTLASLSGVEGLCLTLQHWVCVFSGKVKALMGSEACVIRIGLVPGVLVENLETVAARMVIGLFVDCARVSWSSRAFKTVRPWSEAWC